MGITEGLPLVRWGDSVVGDGVQRTLVDQVVVEDTQGEEAVPVGSKPEGEGVRTAVAIVVLA